MSIPLVATPARVNLAEAVERLHGDDATFDSSLGNWVASGGTLTRDTTFTYSRPDAGLFGGALKHTTTAAGQYVEVPWAGPVKKGQLYTAIFAVSTPDAANLKLTARLGVIGSDDDSRTNEVFLQSATSKFVHWTAMAVQWLATADHTSGLKLRIERHADMAGTRIMYIGVARVVQGRIDALRSRQTGNWYLPGYTKWQLSGQFPDASVELHPNGGNPIATLRADDDASATFTASVFDDSAYCGIFAEHPAGDRNGNGVNIEVGEDFVGVMFGEKDASTVQIYPDFDYDVELLDGSTSSDTRHWHHATADGVRSRLGSWFEQVLRVPGGLSAATNVAEYWRAPYPCRIDEVFVHAGVAPVGAALIVDVNDDGATVFTTQANRPQIADGANDATSGAADGGIAIAKDSVITVDVDQVGSTTPGSDLFVSIRGRYQW